jgi:hypothetical protein
VTADGEYRILTADEAKAILQAGEFDQLIGVLEHAHLDFKRDPYPLSGPTPATHERAKRDLVEDVVRFANVEGGILILGVDTAKLSAQRTEAANSLHPFPAFRFDPGQYRDVVSDRIRPPIQGFEARWFGGRDGREGIAAIIVPPQAEQHRGTFVAMRVMADDETGKTLGAYIGYFERSGAEGRSMSGEELSQTFQAGRRFNELSDRLDILTANIEKLADIVTRLDDRNSAPPSTVRPGPDIVDAGNRRGEAIHAAGLNERPAFSMIAVPVEAVEVPHLFAGSSNPLVRLLENPPGLRYGGFDVSAGSHSTVRPDARRVVAPNYKVLELRRDGVLIFAVDAQQMLCWGTAKEDEPLRLNVLALAESTYLFQELVRRLTAHLRPPPQMWRYAIALERMVLNRKRAVLSAGGLYGSAQFFPHWNKTAPADTFEHRSQSFSAELDPRIIAYSLRQAVYVWFGFDEDAIPYVTDVGGDRGTDTDKIKQGGKEG